LLHGEKCLAEARVRDWLITDPEVRLCVGRGPCFVRERSVYEFQSTARAAMPFDEIGGEIDRGNAARTGNAIAIVDETGRQGGLPLRRPRQ
jgi:hypothetical protein